MPSLSPIEVDILLEALDDEYRARATYDQVIVDFGPVRPFVNIRDAEARHIEALTGLFRLFGVPVPANPWSAKVDRYSSLRAACQAAIAAEIANGEMYERLIASTNRPEMLVVLRNLQAASQERHLPAFQRCLERETKGNQGAGRRRRGCVDDSW